MNIQGSDPLVNFDDTDVAGSDWTLFGDTLGFDVVDETTGNLVFSINPGGAPNGSLFINANGNVGVGSISPIDTQADFPLHVVRLSPVPTRIAQFTETKPNGTSVVGFENNAPVSTANQCGFDFALQSSTTQRVAGRFVCSVLDTNDPTRTGIFQFRVANGGALTESMRITGNRVSIGTSNASDLLRVGNATCNGTTFNNACSRKLKQDIIELSSDAAKNAVMSLAPVTYAYKQEPGDLRVGFIAEDAPELVAMPDHETLSSMDIVAALTKVVQDQERELETLRTDKAETESTLSAVLERLAALEAAK
ncbi:MAG: tail fiber domain-containing protein [Planctomycetaceae bacterium]